MAPGINELRSDCSAVDRRRLSAIGALASALVSTTTIESVAKATVQSLRDCADLPAVEINMIVADSVVRIASLGDPVTGTTDREIVHNAVTTEGPVVLDADWQAGLPARRVAFGIDDPNLQIVVVVRLNPDRGLTRNTSSSSGWSARRSRPR